MSKNGRIPEYGTHVINGYLYYRTRLKDADGRMRVLNAKTPEELYKKEQELRAEINEIAFRKENPTVAEYCEKWLEIRSGTVSAGTLKGYRSTLNNYILKTLGKMYMSDVRSDDIQVALIPASKKSASVYNQVNMLLKSVFGAAERNGVISYNPTARISGKGGKAKKEKEALTDAQAKVLLGTIRGLPPYVFTMIGLYAGLRREEILGLQWDCVFLDEKIPYISVRRAWRTDHNRPVISNILKTPAARRDIPIPKILAECLRQQKEKSISDYVISDSKGNPLSYSQFDRVWKYVKVRSTKEHSYYKYVNGKSIKYTVAPELGTAQKNRPSHVYSIDFDVTPHLLRHTYITNLIHAGIDPKTVQYLAGHENSKTTMDIYAKVKYNTPKELSSIVNEALDKKNN